MTNIFVKKLKINIELTDKSAVIHISFKPSGRIWMILPESR